MPTNFELLKSIHENGGEFEVNTELWNGGGHFCETADHIADGCFSIKNNTLVYRIPSELEVEKKIISGDDVIRFAMDYLPDNNLWTYELHRLDKRDLLSGHESRLTAGLMLWDKLLKEKK